MPVLKTCRCRHTRHAHTHHRTGTDCAFCRCTRYRRRWWAAIWEMMTP